MFAIIRLDGSGKIISCIQRDYKESFKTITISSSSIHVNKTYNKKYFDKVTEHGCVLKNDYHIYTLDDSKIEEHKATLKKFYKEKWKQKIKELQEAIRKIDEE